MSQRDDPSFSHSPDSVEEEGSSGRLERLREILTPAKVIGGIALIVLLFVPFAWQLGLFGSKEEEPAQLPAPAEAAPAAVPTPKAPEAPAQPEPIAAEKEPEKPPATAAPPEPLAPLPEDVLEWKKEDYLRARREGHPKLFEAIVYLGEAFRGDRAAAESLTDLLKPPPAASPQASGQTSPPLPASKSVDVAKVVAMSVAALGFNATEEAQNTLERILSGDFVTEDDRTAVEAVLKAFLARSTPRNNALLLQAMFEAEELRPADREGPWPAKALQAKTLPLIKSYGSVELRTALAESASSQLVKLTLSDPMVEMLLASDPRNCGAQIVFHQNEHLGAELRKKIEEQLLEYGGFVLSRFLKVPVEGSLRNSFDRFERDVARPADIFSASAGKPDAAWIDPVTQIARLLWSEKCRDLPESELRDSASIEHDPTMTLIAATIPQDSTRAALSSLLRRRSIEGPKALESAGLPEKVFLDPGMLVIVKALPRRLPKSGAAPRSRPATGPGKNDSLTLAQRREIAEQEWMRVSGKLVAQWRTHLQAAAAAQKKRDEESRTPANPTLPPNFTPSGKAAVVASYYCSWPEMAPAALADSMPSLLKVGYVRIEETATPKKAAGYYARQAQASLKDSRPLAECLWFDRVSAEEGRRRSTDVLVSWPGNPASALMRDDMEANLVIEVITVEINDPTRE